VDKKEQLDNIVAGCCKNDRVYQEKLFKLYYGKLMVVCMRYTNDKDTAQDILQEGFMKIFDKITSFESTGSFEGWMRRIVTNTALDHLRKSKKFNFVEENEINTKEEFIDFGDSLEFENSIEMKAEFALEAIQQLSPAYKTVFNLYVMEEYSHKEIAEMLGISEGTSKSNLAKAKMNLQKIIVKKYSKIANE
jgi:RNA polymerase sigma-70 factor (ECF subfamily)